MSYSKIIQSMVIVACGAVFISQAQARQLKDPSRHLTPKTCKGTKVAAPSNIKKTENQARQSAIRKWSRIVAGRIGRPYANWRLASRKRLKCEPYNNGIVCRAIAIPCRPGMFFKQ